VLLTLHKDYEILSKESEASQKDIESILERFPQIPSEYLDLIDEVTEIELEWNAEQYLRIWHPDGCLEMDEAYDISLHIKGAIPIGDNGGGKVIFYMNGIENGWGLYLVGFGNLDPEEAEYLASSLTDLLCKGIDRPA
jgi:chorismate synthase